jgi:hypothetical protein
MEGDGDAHDHFHSNGGRRLQSEGQVIMPSGRRLDDGSVVKVLYLYTYASRDRWGSDATMRSMIVGGVASTNQAFAQSGVGVRVEAAAIIAIPYWSVSNQQVLCTAITTALSNNVHTTATAIGSSAVTAAGVVAASVTTVDTGSTCESPAAAAAWRQDNRVVPANLHMQ